MAESYISSTLTLARDEASVSGAIHSRDRREVLANVQYQGANLLRVYGEVETLRALGVLIARIADEAAVELERRPKRGAHWHVSYDLATLHNAAEENVLRVVSRLQAEHLDTADDEHAIESAVVPDPEDIDAAARDRELDQVARVPKRIRDLAARNPGLAVTCTCGYGPTTVRDFDEHVTAMARIDSTPHRPRE